MPIFAILVGARPNFMKAAPLVRAFSKIRRIRTVLIHTGQHYDPSMSGEFFRDLGLPRPDVNLEVGSASQATQTARIMVRLERHLERHRPDCLIVVGDVNSTMAGALVASKLRLPVAHVEAGLRSFDFSMPEEINRVVTDRVADFFFTTDRYADRNLLREGTDRSKIFRVGNVMIDSLARHLPKARARRVHLRYVQKGEPFVVATIHRPHNADNLPALEGILAGLSDVSRLWRVILPVHPRTRPNVEALRRRIAFPASLVFERPLSYLDMLSLVASSAGVITDSGGLQEEAAYLRIPTLTVRPNTERPITIDAGTNHLVRSDGAAIQRAARYHFRRPVKGSVPDLWDGRTSERIARILRKAF